MTSSNAFVEHQYDFPHEVVDGSAISMSAAAGASSIMGSSDGGMVASVVVLWRSMVSLVLQVLFMRQLVFNWLCATSI